MFDVRSEIIKAKVWQKLKDTIDKQEERAKTDKNVKTVEKGRKAYVIIGSPAAGKSSIANQIRDTEGALIVDSDDVKEMYPEFLNGMGAGFVHEESAKVNDEILKSVSKDGYNLILPVVGGKMKSLKKRMAALKAQGYEVNVVHVQIPLNEAIRRNNIRSLQTGRRLPPVIFEGIKEYITIDGQTVMRSSSMGVFAELVNTKDPELLALFDSLSLYDNNVPFGALPELLYGKGYFGEKDITEYKEALPWYIGKENEDGSIKGTERVFSGAEREKTERPVLGENDRELQRPSGDSILGDRGVQEGELGREGQSRNRSDGSETGSERDSTEDNVQGVDDDTRRTERAGRGDSRERGRLVRKPRRTERQFKTVKTTQVKPCLMFVQRLYKQKYGRS